MTRRYFQLITGTALVFIALTPAIFKAQQPRELFERARIVKEANQDLMQAIRLYEQAAAQAKADRALGARAHYRIGQCYEKLGQREAAKSYENIVKNFADQQEIVAQARVRLTALEPGTSARHDTVMANRRVWWGGDVDTLGAVSADGRYLSYQDQETGDLAIRNLQTGEKRRLTKAAPSWNEFVDPLFLPRMAGSSRMSGTTRMMHSTCGRFLSPARAEQNRESSTAIKK